MPGDRVWLRQGDQVRPRPPVTASRSNPPLVCLEVIAVAHGEGGLIPGDQPVVPGGLAGLPVEAFDPDLGVETVRRAADLATYEGGCAAVGVIAVAGAARGVQVRHR